MFKKRLAIVGATGAVGRVFLELLEEKYPGPKDLFLLASKRSAGKKIKCGSQDFVIEDLGNFNFANAWFLIGELFKTEIENAVFKFGVDAVWVDIFG